VLSHLPMRGIQQVSYQPKNFDKGGACAACSCSPASWQALCTPGISRLLKTMCKTVVANKRRSCKCLLCEGLTAGASYPLEYMSVVMRTLLSAHPCSWPSRPCSNCCTVSTTAALLPMELVARYSPVKQLQKQHKSQQHAS